MSQCVCQAWESWLTFQGVRTVGSEPVSLTGNAAGHQTKESKNGEAVDLHVSG